MQGSFFSRLVFGAVVGGMICMMGTLAGASAVAGERGGRVLYRSVPSDVGLALDNRGSMYTADSRTGHVFCLPPKSSPVLLAKVPGRPTVLTVDRLRNVFVGTENGTVYLVSLDGSVDEAYRCASRPVGMEVDRDGGLIIAMEKGGIVRVARASFGSVD